MSVTNATQYHPANTPAVRSESRANRRNRVNQPNDRSTTHRRGNNTNPFLAFGCFTTSSSIP